MIENVVEKKPTTADLLKVIQQRRRTEWREPDRPVYAEDIFKREGWRP